MENNIFFEILKNIPQRMKNFTRLSMGIAADIDDILKQKKMSQKMFADLMEKKESEISKWLSGSHNFTIKSIAKIEEKLETQILYIASEVALGFPDEQKEHTYMQFENIPLSRKVERASKVSDRYEIPIQLKMHHLVLSQTSSEAISIDAFHNYQMS